MNIREFLMEGLQIFFMKITHVCKKCTFMNVDSKIFINLCNLVNTLNLLYIWSVAKVFVYENAIHLERGIL